MMVKLLATSSALDQSAPPPPAVPRPQFPVARPELWTLAKNFLGQPQKLSCVMAYFMGP